jgi:hypothetical protein
MDTDDLSAETYLAIIVEAERFNHDLTLQFGVLASQCKDEHEYLNTSLELIDHLKEADEHFLYDIFFDDIPDRKTLNSVLEKITAHISKVKEIPFEQRHFDF